MCGIFWCLLNNDRAVDVALERFNRLAHRGPDASCHKVVGNHFMGNHRLAIVNPTPEGNQPLTLNELHLICNGQLYNYVTVAQQYGVDPATLRSDVDVILHMHNVRGGDMVDTTEYMDGDFAFVLYDAAKDTTFIGRDPVGVRPLFYGVDEHGAVVCAASEAKAIVGMPGVSQCKVFPPGHVYNSATQQFTCYTKIYPTNEVEVTYDDAVKVVQNSLTNAINKRIHNSDRPIAFLCSGGIDSSLVVAIAHDILKKQDMHMFSVEFAHPSSRSDDSFYATMLAAQLGIKHTIVKFSWEDVVTHIETIIKQIESYDPNTIRASIPMYFLARYIREHTDFKVILSGEGADEVFMGYNIFASAKNADDANLETQRLVKNLHMFDVLRADRTFAAHGLELRVPFLDKDLLHDVFRIPGAHKMYQHSVEKKLLRDAFNDIAPLRATRILDRAKERFSDGCGFGYVPCLLNHWTTASDLSTKEKAERAAYKQVFDAAYPGYDHLITDRVNPAWCKVQGGDMLSF